MNEVLERLSLRYERRHRLFAPPRTASARGVAAALSGHIVEETPSRGWDTLRNGELLDAAQAAGFDVFVTTHRNIR